MIPLKTFKQAPGDQLDYTINWAEFLAGDPIDTVAWNPPDDSPVEIVDEAIDTAKTQTVVWLKSDTAGRYIIACTVTTASTPARIATRAFKLVIS